MGKRSSSASRMVALLVALTLPLTWMASGVQAQSRLAIETDPATFLLDGYAAHLRYYPEQWSHWRVGAGIYSMELPELIVDLKSANEDEGWDVDLSEGVGVFVERYMNRERNGWFLGFQAAHHRYQVSNNNPGYADSDYDAMVYMPYGGYLYEFSDNFYLQAWAGAGLTERISGSSSSGNEDEYEVPRVLPLATFHLGYRF